MNQPTEIRIPDFFRNGIIIWVVVIVALLGGLLTSIYTVQAESRGVVLRFGKYLKTVEPGLRFKLPFGIEKVYVIPVERTLLEEFGFITPGALNPGQSNTRSLRELEKSMITGDLNSAEVEWIVQYRITDPRLYLFEVFDPVGTLRYISESVMRTVVGDRTVDEVITIGREEVEEEAMKRLEIAVQKYELGIGIEQVQLQNVNPPPPVQESFNEVNPAQQEKERMINEAEGEKNKEIARLWSIEKEKREKRKEKKEKRNKKKEDVNHRTLPK